ncbi:hypothetical protein D3C71_1630690 [compost metagenome]
MAGVLHQVHLGQQGVGALLGAAPLGIGHHGRNAVRMDANGRAQVKTAPVALQFFDQPGKRKAQRLGADAEGGAIGGLGGLGQCVGKIAELAGQTVFHRLLQLPDLLLARGVLFIERAHVAAHQALHQLFNVVISQKMRQHGNALLLGFGAQHKAHDQNKKNQ